MFNWDNVKDVVWDGAFFVFTDSKGYEARMDKDALIICVSSYKSEHNKI